MGFATGIEALDHLEASFGSELNQLGLGEVVIIAGPSLGENRCGCFTGRLACGKQLTGGQSDSPSTCRIEVRLPGC